jgi:uncharacterized membrane protein YqjE
MDAPASRPPGLVGRLQALGDGLLATVQDRLQLFSLELQEEKLQLIQAMAWLGAILFAAALALLCASAGIVLLLWNRAPLAALGALAILYTAIAAFLVLGLRRTLARQPKPLAASIGEIESDRQCLRAGS